MNSRTLIIVLVLMLFLASCNLPTETSVSVTDTPIETHPTLENTPLPPTETATPLPSETPLPTVTPLPSPTGTPTVPIVFPNDINVNCRYGYGIEWLTIGALLADQPATIIAKNATGSWWYVTLSDASATKCWVAASVTTTAGNIANLPTYNQSTASVTKVTIEKPQDLSLPGCMGPVQPLSFKGSIEVNGPLTVSWRFESEQSGVLTDHATNFSEAGSKNVADSFVPPLAAGNYWAKLAVIGPNTKAAESNYKIECP